jgi:Flp pilus assembly protein TadD
MTILYRVPRIFGGCASRASTAALAMALLLCLHPAASRCGSTAAAQPPRLTVDQELSAGVEDLRAGRVDAALRHLDSVAQRAPQSEPYLWQRGIAQYLAGRYAAGREQFELHRKVNPNDVENATWHFLCVAAQQDVVAARKAMLPAPGDPRVPMKELYALYQGKGDRAAVEAAVTRQPAGSAARRYARFYADLYLGLLAHAEGDAEQARRWLAAAAETPDKTVMADVARVCHARLVKDRGDDAPPEDADDSSSPDMRQEKPQ